MLDAIQPTETAAVPPAQPAAAAVADPPLLEPAFSVTIDAPAQFRGIVFHPDGTRAFVHVSDPAIDLWPLAVYYWPEILGALAVVLALPALWLIWRRARTPRRVGRVYCRRCNYELGAAGGKANSEKRKANIRAEAAAEAALPARCPECGTETAKRRPIPGRRMLRRLALPVAWVLAVAAVYGSMHAAGLSREGRMSEWFSVWSRLVGRFAAEHSLSWKPYRQRPVDRVLELDLRAGRWARTVCARTSLTGFDMDISCDGNLLFLSPGDMEGIEAIDSRSGRVVAALRRPPSRLGPTSIVSIAPSASKAGEVYLHSALHRSPGTLVERWDARTGGVAECFTHSSRAYPNTPREDLLNERLPESARAAWLVRPLRQALESVPLEEARLLDENGCPVGTFQMVTTSGADRPFILAEPVPVLLVPSANGSRLARLALPKGELLAPIASPRRGAMLWDWSGSAGGSRVLVKPGRGEAWIYDARHERWIARLAALRGYAESAFGLSPDGRFAFAEAFNRPPRTSWTGARVGSSRLAIWDLSRTPPAAGEPSPSGP